MWALQLRALGSQGLTSSAIGLGTMGTTMAYGDAAADGGATAVRRTFELGVTHFDTAELYGRGAGTSEHLLGRVVKGFRAEVVLATKFGFDLTGPSRFGRALDSRPERIRAVIEASPQHLDTDRIDHLYQHRVDPGRSPSRK